MLQVTFLMPSIFYTGGVIKEFYIYNDPLLMWPNKRVQNYIGLKVITVKVISDESLIDKLREVLFLYLHKNLIDLSL